ncbi:DNA cytosine methyltransferase [Kitasatospora sp. NPDC001574]
MGRDAGGPGVPVRRPRPGGRRPGRRPPAGRHRRGPGVLQGRAGRRPRSPGGSRPRAAQRLAPPVGPRAGGAARPRLPPRRGEGPQCRPRPGEGAPGPACAAGPAGGRFEAVAHRGAVPKNAALPGLRIGSLCSGYGGLDLGIQAVLGGTVAWHADPAPAAAAILEAHWPGVPNLGDITKVDFSRVEPVCVLVAGFPCTDVSVAGGRAGLAEGTRSGLWHTIARAISALRPCLVILENVRGLLSTPANAPSDGDVEPCPWCLGDTGDEHPLRALGAVLADLAGAGLDARWQVLRASDVGAPHRRERVFIAAWPADPPGEGLQGPGPRQGRPRACGHAAAHPDLEPRQHRRLPASGPTQGRRPRPEPERPGRAPATDTPGDRRHEGRPEPEREQGRPDAAECRSEDRSGIPSSGPAAAGTPRRHSGPAAGADTAADGRRGSAQLSRWGDYAPAIARWEAATRPAPDPVDSRGRLSPEFVEWVMGLEEGWVTQITGLSRSAQLTALGNGVVPQQASLAAQLLTCGIPLCRNHKFHSA